MQSPATFSSSYGDGTTLQPTLSTSSNPENTTLLERPRKWTNAFILFRNDKRNGLCGSGIPRGDLSKEAGERWHSATPEFRVYYEELAQREKAKYEVLMHQWREQQRMLEGNRQQELENRQQHLYEQPHANGSGALANSRQYNFTFNAPDPEGPSTSGQQWPQAGDAAMNCNHDLNLLPLNTMCKSMAVNSLVNDQVVPATEMLETAGVFVKSNTNTRTPVMSAPINSYFHPNASIVINSEEEMNGGMAVSGTPNANTEHQQAYTSSGNGVKATDLFTYLQLKSAPTNEGVEENNHFEHESSLDHWLIYDYCHPRNDSNRHSGYFLNNEQYQEYCIRATETWFTSLLNKYEYVP